MANGLFALTDATPDRRTPVHPEARVALRGYALGWLHDPFALPR